MGAVGLRAAMPSETAGPTDDCARRPGVLFIASVAATAAMLVTVRPVVWLPAMLVGGGLISAVVLPILLVHFVPARWAVTVAAIIVLVPAAAGVAQRIAIDHPGENDEDDTTILNDEATRLVLALPEPLPRRLQRGAPPDWQDLGVGPDGARIENPERDTCGYLPASFLANVLPVAIGDALGFERDARLLYLAALALLRRVIARHDLRRARSCRARSRSRRHPDHVVPVVGSNDAIAVALFLVAALLARERSRTASVALAVALSFKVVLLVPAIGLVLLVLRLDGMRQLRKWWTGAAVLVASILPYLWPIRRGSSNRPCGST